MNQNKTTRPDNDVVYLSFARGIINRDAKDHKITFQNVVNNKPVERSALIEMIKRDGFIANYNETVDGVPMQIETARAIKDPISGKSAFLIVQPAEDPISERLWGEALVASGIINRPAHAPQGMMP